MPVVYQRSKHKVDTTRRGNSLITRGMGKYPALVTFGHFYILKEVAIRIITVGQSGTKRAAAAAQDLKEIVVSMRLTKVNNYAIEEKIEGTARSTIADAALESIKFVELAFKGAQKIVENIRFSFKRIK